jgi:hypothetical protein
VNGLYAKSTQNEHTGRYEDEIEQIIWDHAPYYGNAGRIGLSGDVG